MTLFSFELIQTRMESKHAGEVKSQFLLEGLQNVNAR